MLARVMVEGEDRASISEIAQQIAAAIQRQLGAS
jgi:hypothetical protein